MYVCISEKIVGYWFIKQKNEWPFDHHIDLFVFLSISRRINGDNNEGEKEEEEEEDIHLFKKYVQINHDHILQGKLY
jgi:hypothetical protein